MNCLSCNTQTNNPKYCSRSCAAISTNKLYPKKKRTKKCKNCGNLIAGQRRIYCQSCKNKKFIGLQDKTLKEVICYKHHKSSAFAAVRSRARNIAKKYGMNSCLICGYSKHIEIAHKKAISSFDLSTKLSVVNHHNNLLPLCPTHHWEFDNNQLEAPLAGLEPT